MAFSRSWLESLGLSEEVKKALIEEHTAATDALKAQRDKAREELEAAKKEAEKIPALQQEIDDLKGGEDYKSKYEQAVKEHEDYVKGVEAKEQASKVEAAYRKMLADEHIKADRIDFVVKHSDLSEVKLDKDGNIVDADALKETINDNVNGWGMFKVTTEQRKQSVPNPPSGGTGTGISRAKELAQKYAEDRYGVKPDTGKE